jgi:RimJ/RimL family protein N-acetyltransferase
VPEHRRLDPEGRPTVDDIARSIGARQAAVDARSFGLLTVELVATGDVIGYCGLVVTDAGAGEQPELAFELLQAVHGRGYATEAATAVIAWAREAGYTHVRASVWDWNAASRRVLEKLGFHPTGRIDKTLGEASSLVTMLEIACLPRRTDVRI